MTHGVSSLGARSSDLQVSGLEQPPLHPGVNNPISAFLAFGPRENADRASENQPLKVRL